jgi:signal transduction histidine kinase
MNYICTVAFVLSVIHSFGQQLLPNTTKTIELTTFQWEYVLLDSTTAAPAQFLTAQPDVYHRGFTLPIPSGPTPYNLSLRFKVGTKVALPNRSLLIENFASDLDVHLNQILVGQFRQTTYIVQPARANLPVLLPDSLYTLRLTFRPLPSKPHPAIQRLLERGLSLQLDDNTTIDWLSLTDLFADSHWYWVLAFIYFSLLLYYITILFQRPIFNSWLRTERIILLMGAVVLIFFFFRRQSEQFLQAQHVSDCLLSLIMQALINFSILALARVQTRHRNVLLLLQLGMAIVLLGSGFAYANYEYAIFLIYTLIDLGGIILLAHTNRAVVSDDINRRPYVLFGNLYLHGIFSVDFYFNNTYSLPISASPEFFTGWFVLKTLYIGYLLAPTFAEAPAFRSQTAQWLLRTGLAVALGTCAYVWLHWQVSSIAMLMMLFNVPVALIFIFLHVRHTTHLLVDKQVALLQLERQYNQDLRQEVQQRTAELHEAVQNREELLRIIAHDFRGQVAQIHNFLHLMTAHGTQWLAHELENFTQSQLAKVKKLQLTIDNVLVWGSSQKKALSPAVRTINVSLLLAELCESSRQEAGLRQLTLCAEIQPHIHQHIDEMHLNIVLRNLLTNSLTYSPKGSVVRLVLTADFIQITNPKPEGSLLLQGTGLGLSITQTLLNANGCAFTFTLQNQAEATILFNQVPPIYLVIPPLTVI